MPSFRRAGLGAALLASLAVACAQPTRSSSSSRTASVERLVVSKLVGDHYQLFEMTADGSAPRRLTSRPVDSLFPSPSPDGRAIAFIARDGNRQSLRVLDRASGETRTLRDDGTSTFSAPNWSASSALLVVSRTPRDLYSRVERIDAKSGRIDEIAAGLAPCFDFPQGRVVCLSTDVCGVMAFDLASRSPDGYFEYVRICDRAPMLCVSLCAARHRSLIGYTRIVPHVDETDSPETAYCGVIDEATGRMVVHVVDGARQACGFLDDGAAMIVLVIREQRAQLLRFDWRSGGETVIADDVGTDACATSLDE